jgi:hypothetical protein
MDKIIIIPTALIFAGMIATLFFFLGVEYLFNRSEFKELDELEKKLY